MAVSRIHDGGEGQIYAWPPISQHKGPLPAVAVYDLSIKPTTYDFITWSVMVKSIGAKAICFKYEDYIADWKYEPNVAWRRFGNILIPATKLLGLPYYMNSTEMGFTVSHHTGWACRMYEKLGRIDRLRPSIPLQDTAFSSLSGKYTTITIRESIRNKYRDSNIPEWQKVKEELERGGKQVVVLEDSEKSGFTLDLEHRMALYSGAEMNLGVSNGPMALCHYSYAPYLTFKMIPDCDEGKALEEHMNNAGFVRGSQYPWRQGRQELVWENDSYDNIMSAYDRVMS